MAILKNPFSVKAWAFFESGQFTDAVSLFPPLKGTGIAGAKRLAAGYHEIQFSRPMPNTDYIVSGSVVGSSAYFYVTTKSINNFVFYTANAGGNTNVQEINVTVSL